MDQPGETNLPNDRVSEKWLVTGTVQGVGFRYHVMAAARRLGVSGDVCNLSDGRVEVRVQASLDRLKNLLAEVQTGPRGSRVESVEQEQLGSGVRFDAFTIR